MATNVPATNGQVQELSREDALALLDREAQRYLHMDAETFLKAWDAGAFDQDPDRPEVMYVAMLLPFVR